MLEKNDWRLTFQEQYLKNAELQKNKYVKFSETWDHDHCAFCWDKFSECEGDIHIGYCTLDKKYWICEECYNDFKEMFNFKIVQNENKNYKL